jgi:hypothetical protein
MNRWLFLFSLGALLSVARAEIPIDLPPDTPTNRPGPGINVPAPLRTGDATNVVVVPPPPARPRVRELFQPAETSGAGDDWLLCTNCDWFAGAFAGGEPGMIHWRVAGHQETIRFREDGVEGIALAGSVTTNTPAPTGWLVFLTDGSVLPARQVTVEGGQVAADLAYAGRVRLERAQVERLRRYDGQHTELVTLTDAPAYALEKAPTTGGAGRVRYRETKLPEPLLLEFPWSVDRSPAGSIQVFAGKLEDISRYLTVDDLSVSRLGITLGSVKLTGWLTNEVARAVTWVGLAVSRQSGAVVLYLNGRRQGATTLKKKDRPEVGLRIVEDSLGRVVPGMALVSHINNDLILPEPVADQDTARLANDDQLTGRIESLSTNELVFHAQPGRFALPLERVAQISFASGALAASRAGAAEFTMRDGSRLRGQWQRADAQSVTIQHAVLGAVTVPRTALAGVYYQVAAGAVRYQSGRDVAVNLAKLNDESQLVRRTGLIHLANREFWQGDLVGIADGIVRWRPAPALDPLEWPVTAVRRVSQLWRNPPAAPATERATVRLANGDVISGLLDGADGETVRLTPWYIGAVAIPRGQVAHLTPHAPVEGALPMVASEAAPLSDGAAWLPKVWKNPLRSTSPIPDRVRLDMELVFSDRLANVEVYMFSQADRLHQAMQGNEYLAAMFSESWSADQGIYVELNGYDGKKFERTNPLLDPPYLTNMVMGGCVTLTVLADRSKRHMRVLADGQPMREWRAAGIAAPTGPDAVVSLKAGENTAVRHVVLREWREDPAPVPAPRPAAIAARTPGDVRVTLHNGDFLTLTDLAADAKTVSGKHVLLGPVTLNMAAVRVLDWEQRPLRTVKSEKR